jgi:MFS superfamily sulfate permease-like transporter
MGYAGAADRCVVRDGGLLHTGSIGAFISRPVLRGFAWGLAVTIVLKQLPHLAGACAGHNAWQLLAGLIDAADAIHWPSVGLGAIALALWLAVHHGLRHVVFLPQSLVVLALGIAASAIFDLGNRHRPGGAYRVAQPGPGAVPER